MSQSLERFALVGTAPSWKDTPWADAGLHIQSLNDAYQLPGFVRADSWVDLHPLDHFVHPPNPGQPMYAHQVPPGHYVRPQGHLEWLAKQATTIPVWLHPDHAEQYPDSAAWPHAQPFPKAAIEAEFGRYFTSSPAWMLANAIRQGAKEIHIYGIHLATEHEYIEQRPNFEFLLGRVLGPGRFTLTKKDGKRYYETAHGLVVLPETTPILDAPFQYGFQPRPASFQEPLKWDLHRFKVKADRCRQQLMTAKPWTRKRPILDELTRYEALIADTHDQMARLHYQQQRGA